MLWLMIVAVVYLLLFGLWMYVRWEHGILEKMGVPVVKHHPLLGSTRDIYTTVGAMTDIKWRDTYGKIFGVYEGRQAQLFICEPELVRLICVKDSAYFDDKRRLEFGDPVLNEMPDFQTLEKWRLLRSLATPAFTSAKVKMMNLPMLGATKDFIADLKLKIKKGNGVHKNFPIDTSIHTMLTDLIGRCVFSIQIKSEEGDNEFAKIVRDMVTPPTHLHTPELVIWSHTFPFMKKYLPSIFQSDPVCRFVTIFKQMMAERRRTGQKYNDIVDMIMEWFDRLDTPEFKKAKITELSLLCQGLVFFFATQDQVMTMVSMVIYHMLKDPEIEKKLLKEVDAVFDKNNGKVEHEQIPQLVYLNACLSEALRLYPFFHRAERVCTKDWSNEEFNLNIKKGMVIQFPIWAINRCEDHNENANEFIPDRFMPENKHKLNQYSSTSFGFGPRNCTGMRFATEAMPLILAHLLRELKFVERENTKFTLIPGGPFLSPHEPIHVDVMERTDRN